MFLYALCQICKLLMYKLNRLTNMPQPMHLGPINPQNTSTQGLDPQGFCFVLLTL